MDRIDAFVEAYEVSSPDAVSISKEMTDSDRSLESVWEDLSEWRTARRHVLLLERALSSERGETGDRPAAV